VRKRLLQSTLAAVGVAVVLLGLPLALVVQVLLNQIVLNDLEEQVRDVQAVLETVGDPRQAPGELDELLRGYDREDRRLLLYQRGPGGTVTQFFSTGSGPVPRTDADLRAAVRRGEPGRVRHAGAFAVTVPGQLGPVTVYVRTVQDDRGLAWFVTQTRLGIVSLALVSFLAAALAALYQGRRLAVPLEQLAASARRLGEGDFSARAPRSGLPEPDEVAAALDTTADRLAAMLERSRSFNADASHQLRTPLTALRLDLEALEAAGADPALVSAATKEADRLEATIAELLALAQAPPGEETLDVTELAAARLDAWRQLARAQGRDVVLAARPVPPVRARAAALGQSLQVLLDNALEYGAGTITVSVSEVAGGVRLCVGDEGPGIPADREATLFRPPAPVRVPDGAGAVRGRRAVSVAAANGHAGRGLPLARSLVEAEGGRLVLERSRPGALLCLLLPAAAPG